MGANTSNSMPRHATDSTSPVLHVFRLMKGGVQHVIAVQVHLALRGLAGGLCRRLQLYGEAACWALIRIVLVASQPDLCLSAGSGTGKRVGGKRRHHKILLP